MAQHRGSPKSILKNDYFDAGVSPSSFLGSQQTASPKSTPKSVSIAPQAETISPLILGKDKEVDDLDLDRDRGTRKPKVRGPLAKRLSGRPSHHSSISSLQSVVDEDKGDGDADTNSTSTDHHLFAGGLVGQISAWIREEKQKRDSRRARRSARKGANFLSPDQAEAADKTHHHHHSLHRRRPSHESEEDVDIDRLEQILKESFPFGRLPSRAGSINAGRRRSSARKALHKASSSIGASSDTDYVDGDILVPSAEAWLDNSKTLAYAGGSSKSTDDLLLTRERTATEDAWGKFKYEILRLTHTLRLKGWRRVPMDLSSEIDVERLSGALTNAVYVVSPPADIPSRPGNADDSKPMPKKNPPKLLLRIYGPQVEHLIDREAELQILRRLSRKRIGPRMLGTFSNGRFEEFFHAAPLNPEDLHMPDTSKQIAKRMRELHDGIDLLEEERDEGAFVWRNWDKWFQRVQEVVSWLDGQVREYHSKPRSGSDAWQERGYVCGTEWSILKDTVEKYRKWLSQQYGGSSNLRQQLVFAHNDTQYGNILRLLPAGESPLLLPANTHKQLVVIDFEYASANTPGLEFANHFTEWCYNYHDAATPWRCNTSGYPTEEEQKRFIRAYIRHRPTFTAGTPKMRALETLPESRAVSPGRLDSISPTNDDTPNPSRPAGPSQSISNLMLDARAPSSANASSTSLSGPPSSSAGSEAEATAAEDAEVERLMHETRLWRLANSAQWVAWGIVQAKVPGMPLFSPSTPATGDSGGAPHAAALDGVASYADIDDIDEEDASAAPTHVESERQRLEDEKDIRENEEEEAKEAEFDYLAYARDRAMFFWGDAVGLGLVALEDLSEEVRKGIKIVRY